MNIDHRAEAEKEIRLITEKRLTEPDDIRDSITVASMHALLAIHDLLAARLPQTPPSSAPAAPVSDEVAPEAPVAPQGATGPQKGAGRIRWLCARPTHPFRYLARELDGGWSTSDHDHNHDRVEWPDAHYPDAVFTPLLPGFFVAPDAYGTPTIWQETDGEPCAVLLRYPYNADLFDAVAGLLETREEA